MTSRSFDNSLHRSDSYSHIDDKLVYTETSIPGKGIDKEMFYSLHEGCQCLNCVKDHCACFKKSKSVSSSTFDNCNLSQFSDSFENSAQSSSISSTKILNRSEHFAVLSDDSNFFQLQSGISTFECNDTCTCNASCSNKVTQKGPIVGLKIINYGAPKGYGVVCENDIVAGEFICEYAGEIIGIEEARNRFEKQNERQYLEPTFSVDSVSTQIATNSQTSTSHPRSALCKTLETEEGAGDKSLHSLNYILILNEIFSKDNSSIKTILDPTVIGNIGRYLNHSCEPNCMVIPIRVNSFIPIAAIFASKYIPAGVELAYDYEASILSNQAGIFKRTETSNCSKTPCLCGAKACRTFLPSNTALV